MRSLFLFASVLFASSVFVLSQPPLFPGKEIGHLKEYVQVTRRTAASLKLQIAEQQRKLTQEYSYFELDEKAIKARQEKIMDLQRQLLMNYHHLQVELRRSIGRRLFFRIKRRIDEQLKLRRQTAPPEPPPGPE